MKILKTNRGMDRRAGHEHPGSHHHFSIGRNWGCSTGYPSFATSRKPKSMYQIFLALAIGPSFKLGLAAF